MFLFVNARLASQTIAPIATRNFATVFSTNNTEVEIYIHQTLNVLCGSSAFKRSDIRAKPRGNFKPFFERPKNRNP
jgi:hypothetical protein